MSSRMLRLALVGLVALVVLGTEYPWWRWLRGWVLYIGGRIPHPALLESRTVQLDTQAILDSARSGEAFALPLNGRHVEVLLSPESLGEPRVVELGGESEEERSPGEVASFSGSVVGQEKSEVRLTITERSMTGYVMLDEGWYFIDPLRRFRPKASPREFVIYRTKDIVFRFPFGNDGLPGTSTPTDSDHRTNPHVGIAIWSDEEYEEQANDIDLTWWQAQSALVNMVNGIFKTQVNVEFQVRLFVLDRRANTLTTDDAEDLLSQFGDVVRALHGDIRQLSIRQRTDVEVAHLATGRNLSGKTLGIAWQPGVWGLSQQTLLFRVFGLTIPTVMSYANMMIAAHELGHNFTGDHDEAKKICVSHFIVCWDNERTLMWPTYYSDNQDSFSASNDSRVTLNAQSGRNVNFTHP